MKPDAAAMIAKLQKVLKIWPTRVGAALYQEGQIIMTESKKRCPVAPDGGTLRASGQAHPPEYAGPHISVTLSYGGAAEAYAIAVHEHLSEHSPPSWKVAEAAGRGIHWNVPGTGPKFLEGPINEAQPTLAARIAQRINLNEVQV